jgi:succinate dehydrogenase / fumarate reductase flavoprotein subunit/L-aspartate oxidase
MNSSRAMWYARRDPARMQRGAGFALTISTPACGSTRRVWERANPGILEQQFPNLMTRTRVSGIDPRIEPLLVHPTLHYQNGGAVIDTNGATTVPGLYAVGEVAGGIHGRNRIMGNALLEIISFGRRAGIAATANRDRGPKKVTLEHVNRLRRALTLAGMPLTQRAPRILPDYAAGGVWNR